MVAFDNPQLSFLLVHLFIYTKMLVIESWGMQAYTWWKNQLRVSKIKSDQHSF